jgi:hypothetical protein
MQKLDVIKRLSSAPAKKSRKIRAARRGKTKVRARRTAPRKAAPVNDSTSAAESIFLIYDAAEARHGKA